MTLPLLPVRSLEDAQFNFDKLAQQFPLGGEHIKNALRSLLMVEPGDLKHSARTTPSSGWLLCDGASYLRADYPDLFNVIGTTYGSADGAHFNVPDYRDRVLAGVGDSLALADDDGLASGSRWGRTHTHNVAGQSTDGPHHAGVADPPSTKEGSGVAAVTPWHFYYNGHTHDTADHETDAASAEPPYGAVNIFIKT